MNDDNPLAPPQPGAGGEPPAPPAADPPTPPAADPPTPPADDNQLTPEEQQEADEWDKAAEDIFPGLKKSGDDDEQTKSDKKPQEDGAGQKNPQDQKPNAEQGNGDDAKAKSGGSEEDGGKPDGQGSDDGAGTDDDEDGSAEPPELSPSDRQALENSVRAEVAQKMFTEEINGKSVVTTPDGSKYYLDANGKPMLADSDGDPIRSIDDVMKLINPRTGEPFTEEQAGMWLLNAQQQMRDNVSAMNERIDQIASTGLSMKEDSELISWQYGELLKAMPELRAELWTEYEKTLIKDPKTGIVTKAPVSLQKFYETALEPYAALGRRLEAEAAQRTAEDTKAAEATKQQEEQRKKQSRQDRSDIYGGGKIDDQTDEDKEWAAAAEAVFGPLK